MKPVDNKAKIKPAQLFIFHKPYSDVELESLCRNKPELCDYQFFKYLRFLEHNERFQDWVKSIRKKANIPEGGYDWKENKLLTGFKDIKEVDRKYIYFLEDTDLKYLVSMLRRGQKDKLESLDWSDLITSNALRLPFGRLSNLSVHPDKYSQDNRKFTITFDNHFTHTDLQKYLKEHWWFLKRYIPDEDLPHELGLIKFRERDFYALYLRDVEGLKFSEIADKLTEKYPLKNDIYSEDYAKNLYHRAKAKSDLTFHERNATEKGIS